jgi:hypothetical protein
MDLAQFIPLFIGKNANSYSKDLSKDVRDFRETLISFFRQENQVTVPEGKEILLAWPSLVQEGHIGYYTRERMDRIQELHSKGTLTHEEGGNENSINEAFYYNPVLRKRFGFHAKPGKFIRKLMTLEDSRVEYLATYWKTGQLPMNKPRFIAPEDINWAYLGDNYEKGNGVLQNSCMRSLERNAYIDFYSKNNVGMVVIDSLMEKGKIAARALVWKIPRKNHRFEEFKGQDLWMMDRIYSSKPELDRYLSDWALSQGMIVRIDSKTFRTSSGNKVQNRILKYPIEVETPQVPYLDTMHYYDPEKKLLSNKKIKNSNPYFLRSTMGEYGRRPVMRYSYYHGRNIRDEDAVYSHLLEDYFLRYAVRVIWVYSEGEEFNTELNSPREENLYKDYAPERHEVWDDVISLIITKSKNFRGKLFPVYDPEGGIRNNKNYISVKANPYLSWPFDRDGTFTLSYHIPRQEEFFCHKDHTVEIEDEGNTYFIPTHLCMRHISGRVMKPAEWNDRSRLIAINYIEKDGIMNIRYSYPSETVHLVRFPVKASDRVTDWYPIPATKEQILRIIKSMHYDSQIMESQQMVLDNIGISLEGETIETAGDS